MRRSLLTVCAALVLVVGTARPADARMEELIDWLMELSGPGPFKGLRVEWEYMCYGTLRPGYSSGIFEGSDAKKETVHPASKCYSLQKDKRQMHFGVTGSVLTKADSHYDTAEPVASLDPEVTAFPFGATFDMTFLDPAQRLGRMLEAGVTMSGVRFSGQRFEPFWVPRFEARLTFRPGGHDVEPNKLDAVLARVMVQWVGSVTPEQFGGLPGDSSGTHVKLYATVGIDIERLFFVR